MKVRNRILALGAVVLALAVALIFWGTSLTYVSQSAPPPLSQEARPDPKQNQPLDLDQAADRAEDFSEDVYHGLDTTKEIIGKTEARNQAIEQGRSTASGKLKDLADRARQAEATGDPVLSETDKRVLKNISE
ncbi:hypothetical protein [Nodosilinea sp. E11]|uniref:hypothetical protein n=1 Tax=Nodosilinea sp. E11 TaxID=3037479 RepID=UPI002934FBD9|nr:hypothetical protein [Nodosilinea sp. E11]WOD39066.1 hypothetical protein RRF56_22935 [Nodosilinea sp. E11]